MQQISTILLFSVLAEALITYAKTFLVEKKFQWQMLLSMFIGVFLSITYRLDFLSLFGLSSQLPFVGRIITGMIISRGSNYVFDLIEKISSLNAKTNSKEG